MKKTKGFSLAWVLCIVVITSIVSALTTGAVIYNNNKISGNISYADLSKDEALNQFLEVYANISNEYYENVDKSKMLEKAIAAMMDYLGDDYSDYLNDKTTADLMEQLNGKYTGMGVSIKSDETNVKRIMEVFENSPADRAGIQVGDIIIGVNELDVESMSSSEVVKIIKEMKGEYNLKINRNGTIIVLHLQNEEIASCINYKMVDGTNIGYLQIKSFASNLGEEVHKSLEAMEKQGMQSLIIDVRDNTGGYLDAAVDVSSTFLKKGQRIYSLSNKNNVEHTYDETDESKNYPIVILTNKNSASASEILTGALKQSYGATVVGETTFGKGKVQQTMKLENGSMVKYTSAYWLLPDGTCIDKVGIKPDVEVKNEPVLDENGVIIDESDFQLKKAVDILKGE